MGETERQTDRDRETGRQTGIVFFKNFYFNVLSTTQGHPRTGKRQADRRRQTDKHAGRQAQFLDFQRPVNRTGSPQDKTKTGRELSLIHI